MKLTAFALFLAVGTSGFAADVPATAKGTFKSKAVSLEIASAVAFRGEGLLDKDRKDMLLVVVSNVHIVSAVVGNYYDRRRAIDKRMKDDQTGFVTFELTPDGKYRGYTFYFAPGNGCGYCGGGDVASTVKLSQGKVTGSLKFSEGDRSFDITLDTPLLSDDHGAPLPANGGDPGKAYMAYHAALLKSDETALKAVLSDDSIKMLEGAQQKKKVAGYFRYLSKEHPTKSVRVVRGFSKPDKAVLLIEGESPYAKLFGEVLLVKERGAWRVDDELTDVKMD